MHWWGLRGGNEQVGGISFFLKNISSLQCKSLPDKLLSAFYFVPNNYIGVNIIRIISVQIFSEYMKNIVNFN